MLDLVVGTIDGQQVIHVSDNYIRHNPRPDVELFQVPGNVRIDTPCSEEFLPDWALRQMRVQEPDFAASGRMTALAISVLRPGLARIEGVWAQQNRAVIITRERLSFVRPDLIQPISLIGDGEASGIYCASTGVIDTPLFGFEGPATLNVGVKRQ